MYGVPVPSRILSANKDLEKDSVIVLPQTSNDYVNITWKDKDVYKAINKMYDVGDFRKKGSDFAPADFFFLYDCDEEFAFN